MRRLIRGLIVPFALPATVLAFGLGDLGDVVDVVTSDDVQTALDLAEAFREAGRELSDSEEYFLGRAVAATILSMHSPVDCEPFQEYLNKVGCAVALASPTPVTYGGWHFMLLDSDEINAMSCPGGFIFISRGLLDQVASEDELACVLAHEVAHVSLSHGIRSVESAKWVDAFSMLGTEAASRYGSDEMRELTDGYGDIVTDITSSLATSGYSRSTETEADQYAVAIASAAGYDPGGLAIVLERMSEIDNRSGPGFWQTHPSPEDRISDVEEALEGTEHGWDHQQRDARFSGMLALLEGWSGGDQSGGIGGDASEPGTTSGGSGRGTGEPPPARSSSTGGSRDAGAQTGRDQDQ